MARVHARKNKIVTGLTKGVEFLFKKNKIDVGQRHRPPRRRRARSRSPAPTPRTLTRARDHRRHRFGAAQRARHRRSTASTSSRATRRSTSPRCRSRSRSSGSGAVGVEFASIFRRFGSEVTVIELLPRLVPNEDEAVSAELEKAFKKRGIAVRTGTKVTSATVEDGGVTIEMEGADGKSGVAHRREAARRDRPRAGDRRPRRRRSGPHARSRLHQGRRRCSAPASPGISAIGDVITMGTGAHPQLAHLSSAEGIVLAERLAGHEVRPINYDHVPACTYCDPGDRQRRADRAGSRRARLRRARRHVPVRRARPREDGRRDRRLREDRRREEVRRSAGRAHDRPARDRAGRRSRASRCGSSRPSKSSIRTIHAHPTMSEAVGEAAHAVHGAAIHI